MSLAVADEIETDESGGAGGWSIKGFDYQVDVSVRLALDLMVASRLTEEMTLEHVSEEDVEADVNELEPGAVADAVPMRGYRLIVQAKRRTTDAWTEAKFIKLLQHGKARKSAILRLEEDANARYLLVTSAAVNGSLRRLQVRNAGIWPPVARTPAKVAAAGKNLGGRLAIIGSADDDRLESDIKAMLLERFRVPRARWRDCRDQLRRDAWSRMRGKDEGRWTRTQVERVLLEHEAYFLTDPQHENYVRPTNWGDFVKALTARNAIMLIGQSGSGKTETAEALWRDRKTAIPDLKRVHITHGPDQLRADTTLPPVLYDIEDPWGRFRFEPDSRAWNDHLATAFASARHDRLFIATSRSDVAAASSAEANVQRWRMPLNAENYGRPQLKRLYANLSRDLPPHLAAFAHEHERSVLRQLTLPLEIRKFFDGLADLDAEALATRPLLSLADAVRRAHQNAIEDTVVQQLEHRGAIRPASILWALIKPYGRLSADVLRSIDDALADADPSLEDQIGPLAHSFIAARNFRQGADGSFAYYHGKVEAGFETVLARHPQPARRTLRLLIDALLKRDDDRGGSWGLETSVEIVRLSQRIPGLAPQLSRASQDRLDRHIEDGLDEDGLGLEEAIRVAAAVGSPRSNLAEAARWLEHRPDPGFPGLLDWGKPDRPAGWAARLRADPRVHAFFDRFVRQLLPTDQTSFPMRFAEDLADLAGDLSDAFLSAAQEAVHLGWIRNDDVLAQAALADLIRFEPILDLAAEVLRPTDAKRAERDRIHLIIANEEVDEDYQEHLLDADDGATARTFLDHYVRKVRNAQGWHVLARHRHHEMLRIFWLQDVKRSRSAAQGELPALVKAAFGTDDEAALWDLLSELWESSAEDDLARRIAQGHDDVRVRAAATDCFAQHAPQRFIATIEALCRGSKDARLAELASDLVHRARSPATKSFRAAIADLTEQLPADFREVAAAETAALQGEPVTLSDGARARLEAIAHPSDGLRKIRIRIARHSALDASADIPVVLRGDDHDAAVEAIEVAVLNGMTATIEGAIDHRFAHVAARALTVLAAPLPAPLPAYLLARAERVSSPVRKALIAQLADKPHPKHLETLRRLVDDRWSRFAMHDNDDGNYPVARGAIDAIFALDDVPDSMLGEFIAIARETDDLVLMTKLLSCVLRLGNQERQSEVVQLSRKGQRIAVGRSAASALLGQSDRLTDETLQAITPQMVVRLPATIAAYHVLTIGFRGSIDTIATVTRALAESDDRKIFLALLALAVSDRDPERSRNIAARLPKGHPARHWAEGEDIAIEKSMLIDLGDASAVNSAFHWLKPETPDETDG